jgi:hypothetical protein
MKILSKRNALVGWAVLLFARSYAKRRLRRAPRRLRYGR